MPQLNAPKSFSNLQYVLDTNPVWLSPTLYKSMIMCYPGIANLNFSEGVFWMRWYFGFSAKGVIIRQRE